MNNEDKILSMLEGLTTTVSTLVNKVDSLEQDMKFVKDTVIRIENDHGRALSLLQDGYTANHELYERHEPRIDKLEDDVDRLDTKVKVLSHAR